MKLRVLFVIGSLEVGGAERHLVQVLPRLLAGGVDPVVFTFTHKGSLATVLESQGIRIIEPPFAKHFRKLPPFLRNALIFPIAILTFVYCVLRLRPSVVHFFLPEAYLLGGIASLAFSSLVRIMSRRSLNRYQLKNPKLARIERWLHGHMDAVLGNSLAVVQELRTEGVSDSRLGLLYNGIDLALFERVPPFALFRQSLGSDGEELLLVCVANLIPYKGHADLIRALGIISADLPRNWHIAMVGRDNGIAEELRGLTAKEGIAEHVLWLGERSDAIAIYSVADIGILCSHQEGFSNSILEGMAAGVAMVVTDVGGNGEAVIDGECGYVVPPRTPTALAQAILKLAVDKKMRMDMGSIARRRVVEKFSLDACAGKYVELYRSLINDRNCEVAKVLSEASSQIPPHP